METFNEACILILIDFGLCFTKAVTESEARYMIGFFFIGGIGLILTVHIVILLTSSLKGTRIGCKRYRYKSLLKKLNKKQKMYPMKNEEQNKIEDAKE